MDRNGTAEVSSTFHPAFLNNSERDRFFLEPDLGTYLDEMQLVLVRFQPMAGIDVEILDVLLKVEGRGRRKPEME